MLDHNRARPSGEWQMAHNRTQTPIRVDGRVASLADIPAINSEVCFAPKADVSFTLMLGEIFALPLPVDRA
jgi:hypothetical protein